MKVQKNANYIVVSVIKKMRYSTYMKKYLKIPVYVRIFLIGFIFLEARVVMNAVSSILPKDLRGAICSAEFS